MSVAAVAPMPEARPAPAPLRIAVLSYGLPVPGRKRGGIERVAHDLADGLGRRGHAVTVFSHDPKPAGVHYDVEMLPWRGFVDSWIGRRLTMGYLGNVLALLPTLETFDVALAHGDSLLLPLKRAPFVRVVHGTAWEEARSATSVGRFLMQAGIYLQELLSAATHAASVGVSENTRRGNPFVRQVIPNGVNRRVFFPDEQDRSPVPSLTFVGALTGRKRGRWLLDLFASVVRPAFPDAELHMVAGPGPRADGVQYHEGVTDEQLAVLYRRAWLYASPSTYEGFGLPYLEALACGAPVVATANPGSREVLSDGGAILCDDTAFGPAVVRLLSDARDRDRLRREGLRVAERFDLERTLDGYERLLAALAAERAKTRS